MFRLCHDLVLAMVKGRARVKTDMATKRKAEAQIDLKRENFTVVVLKLILSEKMKMKRSEM